MTFSTEYQFCLPKGYIDDDGNLHQKGVMRLANAGDEINSTKDSRVQTNPAYLSVIVLSRVITKLGTLPEGSINPKLIEKLFISDFAYLRSFYENVNANGNSKISTVCPKCENKIEVDIASNSSGSNASD